jgi:leucine dehydrogenase
MVAIRKNKRAHPSYEALMRYARRLGFGDIHTKVDTATGLNTIIAVHSTKLGPAIGGVRFYPYANYALAMKDVLRLSYMMTIKAAACDLPHGGAKAVVIKPKNLVDRDALFRSFGDFVDHLSGRYITAMDVGTFTHDMDVIAERTPYVAGAAGIDALQSDPSPYTAQGVFNGMLAAVKFKFDRDSLAGMHVAMQGGGNVGYHLAKLLHEHEVKITIYDNNPEVTQRFAKEFGAQVVTADEIYTVACDIFSPCAIGGTINLDTLHRINAKIIAGSANNQLSHYHIGVLAHNHGILYAPDFVINAGGLIQVAATYDYNDVEIANKLIAKMYDRMLTLFETSAKMNLPTNTVAENIAKEKIAAKKSDVMEV